MKKYGLTGCPLGHSLSPKIHARLFDIAGVGGEYKLYPFSEDEIIQKLPVLKSLDGFNITIPYKTVIYKEVDELSEKAKIYGAINTVKCGGKTVGHNTDVAGFTRSIALLCGKTDMTGMNICIVGAGGVGRMMTVEAALSGAELTVAVIPKDVEMAEDLKKHILTLKPGGKVTITQSAALQGGFDLICNATPVGMYPNTDAMPVSEKALDGTKYLFDCIYNPKKTKLMQLAEGLGIKILGGMHMLVSQAAVAQEIWYGYKFSENDIVKLTKEMENELI